MNPQKANKLVFFVSFGIILFLLNAPLRVGDEMEMRNRQISSNIVIDTEKKGLIIAVINTPKSGTGMLANNFIHGEFFQCQDAENLGVSSRYKNCINDRNVIRTHDAIAGNNAILAARQEIPNGAEAQCVILTATRDPILYVVSNFAESYKRDLCDGNYSYEEMEARFHNFVMNEGAVQVGISGSRPTLFKAFGTTFKEEMKKIRFNGGYSVIQHSGKSDEPFQNCELLFLDMEYSKQWNDILQTQFSGLVSLGDYYRTRKGHCPNMAEKYDRLQKRGVTEEELAHILNDPNQDVREYFAAYGYEAKH